ncbi:MAG: ribose 5-phosphate isomerase B [Cytophagales bacterium]|nr:ribose 5-phosphate isomerase B [Cytophagales bacterium]
MMSLKIAIGGDHAGFAYKKEVIALLESKGYEVKDFGPYSEDSCDYPDYVHPLAQGVESKEFNFGIIICGSGNGVNMVANKYQDIRSALVWQNDLAALARQHNNANVLAIPARFVSLDDAKTFVDTFITTDFEGGRHENRVNKIACK